jgi:nitroreductase / dihydropteridine reductase
MNLIKTLNWRYATKKYSTHKVTEDDLAKIIDAINLSASSAGMQTYRLFVIENPEMRKKLGSDSFNPQIVEASHLLLFAAFDSISQETIDNYIQLVAKVREMPVEDLADFKSALGVLLSRTDDENFIWSAKQAYLALGTGLIAAATLQIDATPMEGFNNEKFDEILGLRDKGLKSVVLLALGYRDEENDKYAKLKKVRVPKEEFVIRIK